MFSSSRYRFQGAARETWDPGGAEGRQTHPPNPGPPRPNTGASSQQGGEASEATPTEVLESDGTTATTDPLGGEEGEGTAEGEGQGEEEGEEEVEHPPRKRARKKKREPGVPVRPRSEKG